MAFRIWETVTTLAGAHRRMPLYEYVQVSHSRKQLPLGFASQCAPQYLLGFKPSQVKKNCSKADSTCKCFNPIQISKQKKTVLR